MSEIKFGCTNHREILKQHYLIFLLAVTYEYASMTLGQRYIKVLLETRTMLFRLRQNIIIFC